VVSDVLVSAFDSAGQRCSALRVLCLQEDIAERVLTMLKGAMAELSVGDPRLLSTDIGPVITEAAREGISRHVAAMRAAGCAVHAPDLPTACADGIFAAPTVIEIARLGDLSREVFGPVLHVVRYRRAELDALIDDINATGYALTFAIHSRIDETIAHVTSRIAAGNIYVNRNQIGAVVGVQPFGGHALSGTGPKAGGPLYLRRLLARHPADTGLVGTPSAAALDWQDWLRQRGRPETAAAMSGIAATIPHGLVMEFAGPVGERNLYALEPRGRVLCVAGDEVALLRQIGTVLAAGGIAVLPADAPHSAMLVELPASLRRSIVAADDALIATVLHDGPPDAWLALLAAMAEKPGPILSVHGTIPGSDRYAGEWLLQERSISTNTAAAGGNANLMSIG
jgi:RHH-type proline utilization regulon transcriptional repressor/proline dehydrogenase/delta 1-pyrroline-5-carboxylate dehydrogenase